MYVFLSAYRCFENVQGSGYRVPGVSVPGMVIGYQGHDHKVLGGMGRFSASVSGVVKDRG